MANRDLLIVLDARQSALQCMEYAATLAAQFDAHLIGLYIAVAPTMHYQDALLDIGALDIPLLAAPAETSEQTEKVREVFEAIAKRHAISAEWRHANGYPAEIAALHGRYADLIVLGQRNPDDGRKGLFRARPEEVAMLAGRPVLVVPYAGRFEHVARRVVVGWDASREAARAVNDAIPLLAAADAVTVLTIDAEGSPMGHGDIPGADIALHLARHGVKAQVARTASGGIGTGEILLSYAADFDADLLVMGAYGHSRVRELLLGGATRTVLASMTLPVLMAH